jgi:hypothetical protein
VIFHNFVGDLCRGVLTELLGGEGQRDGRDRKKDGETS